MQARAGVARGQAIFNTKPILLEGVPGLNNNGRLGNLRTVNGTCSTCHNTPNSGNHSVEAYFNIGISGAPRRTPDLPLYTFQNKATGETIQSTDPGRALITGKWNDINRFKVPSLRGLAARPPYFHNGSAPDLKAVVDFYQRRFVIPFSQQEKDDLVAFLKTL